MTLSLCAPPGPRLDRLSLRIELPQQLRFPPYARFLTPRTERYSIDPLTEQ